MVVMRSYLNPVKRSRDKLTLVVRVTKVFYLLETGTIPVRRSYIILIFFCGYHGNIVMFYCGNHGNHGNYSHILSSRAAAQDRHQEFKCSAHYFYQVCQ